MFSITYRWISTARSRFVPHPEPDEPEFAGWGIAKGFEWHAIRLRNDERLQALTTQQGEQGFGR
jgi:hypothetical protein